MSPLHLAYSDDGPSAGEPILLLHGYPLNRGMWDETTAHLIGQGYRVIRPDLRGHGLSPITFEPASMSACADDVLSLADDLALNDFRLGGFSVGGYIAFEIHRKDPRRVRNLLLVDTRADPDAPEARAKRMAAVETARTQGMSAIADDMIPKLLSETTRRRNPALEARVRHMITSTPAQGAINILRGMADRPDQRPQLPKIQCPTVIVVGAEDKLTPPDASMAMHRAIRGSQIRIVTNAAHLTPVEAPEPFHHFLDHWVKETFPKPLGGIPS
ncbi:MAG: alpha/beta fold hydrolase [Euryarchaeota archaeon]|nr:alpha/beta fold hydrolase [Euryarchaeota archaeon]